MNQSIPVILTKNPKTIRANPVKFWASLSFEQLESSPRKYFWILPPQSYQSKKKDIDAWMRNRTMKKDP